MRVSILPRSEIGHLGCHTLVWSAAVYVITCATALMQRVSAATYYIDYQGGSDTSNGLTQASAWKKHPFMNAFGGAYTHQVGDIFVFKGGVTWSNEAFALIIRQGGSAAKPDQYTVDRTWFYGSEWSRPIFDLENQTSTGSVRPLTAQSVSWILIDSIEIMHQRIDQGKELFAGGIYLSDVQNVVVSNCYLHDWFVATTNDSMYGGIITHGSSNIVIDACHVRGTIAIPPDRGSGAAVYFNSCRATTIRNCEMHDTTEGAFGADIVHDCHIYDIRNSFDPQQHECGVWLNPGSVFYNNIVHDLQSGASISIVCGWAGISSPIRVYNNVVYRTLRCPMVVTPSGATSGIVMRVFIYNNTIVRHLEEGAACVDTSARSVDPIDTLDVRNNHFIIDATAPVSVTHPVLNLTITNNIMMSVMDAAAAGYAEASGFAPDSRDDITVDSGWNLSAFFSSDNRGIRRPQFNSWDVGAYEFCNYRVSTPQIRASLLNRAN
jgi:hypothetical protein